MRNYKADEWDADGAAAFLHEHGHSTLRVKKRGALLTIESGPEDAPIKHARLRRDTVHLWLLEIADHRGRFEPTGFRDSRDKLLETLINDFPWVLTQIY